MHVGRKQSWKTGFLYQLSFWHACVFILIVLVCFFWSVQSTPQNAIQFSNNNLTSYYSHSLGASSARTMGPSLPLSMGSSSGQSLGILGAQSVIPSLPSSSMGSFSDHGLGTLVVQNMGPSLPRSMDPSSGQSLGTSSAHSMDPPLPPSRGPSSDQSLGTLVAQSVGPSLPRSMGPSSGQSLGTSSAHSMDPPLPPSRGPSSDQSLGTLVAQSVGPSLPRSMDPLFVHVDAEQKVSVDHQDALLKGKDLDLLLRAIQGLLERGKRGEKEERLFRQYLLDLFNQDGSFHYYCPLNNPYLEEIVQVVKGQGASREEAIQGTKRGKERSGKGEQREKGGKSSAVDVMGDEHKSGIKAEYGKHARRGDEKRERNGTAKQMNGDEDQRLLPKGLYKKGYDFILSANYAEAEKVFCAFQKLYKRDPLVGDAVFWLAESLLGQERYHEAAQVYLYVWYTYKDTLYGSEILLKLAMSVAALGQNKAACDVFADIPKHYQTLECVFCKRLKQEQSRSQCSPN
ncbi:Tol-Pal system protein YbgF [Bartonella bovis]|uniref:Tol-Pal system protein YbgF n=2 Tax=Bartonella bovis TaxID=155194 RepID=N6UJ47_9HYPH|nr:Tol-Pal system protein YbgF [Bartonella bovis]ENN90273.1 Tol-Pal system protein YbgF [Bartonella bovis 91-4]